jgi:putative peptidoglycan lipid II flippase
LIGGIVSCFSRLHQNHRRILAGAAAIGLLTFVAKLFVAAREMAIAWRFGVSPLVDAYQLALTITTWLPMMLTSVMTVVLVPKLVALRSNSDQYDEFIAELNGNVLLLGLLVAGVSLAVLPLSSRLLQASASASAAGLTSALAEVLSPIAFCSVAIGYLSARLQARQRFAYSVTEAAPAIVIGAAVLLPLPWGGASRLAGATVLGFVAQLILLLAMTRGADRRVGAFRIRHRSRHWSALYGSILVMAAAQATLALTAPLDQGFAAGIGEGAVATLGYANRILGLLTGMGAMVLARALLPVLSASVAERDFSTGSRHARQWSMLLLLGGAIGAALIWLLAPWAVRLIFERGAFTEADALSVARVLRLGGLQLPFYFGGLALVQWIAARGRFGSLFVIAGVALALKAIMNLLLVPALGLGGIMMATAAMYAVSFGCQYFAASRN